MTNHKIIIIQYGITIIFVKNGKNDFKKPHDYFELNQNYCNHEKNEEIPHEVYGVS